MNEREITSSIYRTRSYIPTLQPSIVTLKMAANAKHQWIMWYLNIFITNQPSMNISAESQFHNRIII